MPEDFSVTIGKLVDRLESKNDGIRSMGYFYNFARSLYTGYLDSLKNSGKKIVGVFCNFVPEELIFAAGAFPLRLCSGFGSTVQRAEQIMPANFCPMIKSSYGQMLEDAAPFRASDVIVLPTTCDGKKKLGELMSDYKPTWVLEVPHTNETTHARALWLSSVNTFKKEIQKLTGRKITAKSLRQSIELCNRKRAAVRRLYDVRKRQMVPIWGRDVMLVTNMSSFDEPVRYIAQVEELCNELEAKQTSVSNGQRLLLTGSPIMFPALKIAMVLEDSGGIIVTDDICTGAKTFHDPVMPAHWTMDDMLVALADKYLMNTCPCFTPNAARLIRLQQLAQEYRVQGMIYYILQACHTYNIEAHNIQKAFKAMGIPVLKIETDYGEQDVGQLKVRMEAFGEMLQGQLE